MKLGIQDATGIWKIENYQKKNWCKNLLFQFAPELVLVSAGFDAAKGDPLVSETLLL